ncbi:MAG: methyltransferase domain-containing protein [Bacteroidales bacterium]|nr:methyltransferase domain-containing protein [Bacteroidales bacterium]
MQFTKYLIVLFTNRDIADYYNQTQPHYQLWWKLEKALAVHYGIWYPETSNFVEALQNTNKAMLQLAGDFKSPRILDAGCGVGGSSFFLAKMIDARVTGITLSEKQLTFALEQMANSPLHKLVDFKLEDYAQTSFPDQTFDVVWAIESITSAQDKAKFANEANRILKPGGVLVMADYFRIPEKTDKYNWLEKWRQTWSLAPIITLGEFKIILENEGLKFDKAQDFTREITPTSRRMFYASLAAAIPSVLYNTFHDTSKFAKTHYKSGFYQYRALKKGLWRYQLLRFVKH